MILPFGISLVEDLNLNEKDQVLLNEVKISLCQEYSWDTLEWNCSDETIKIKFLTSNYLQEVLLNHPIPQVFLPELSPIFFCVYDLVDIGLKITYFEKLVQCCGDENHYYYAFKIIEKMPKDILFHGLYNFLQRKSHTSWSFEISIYLAVLLHYFPSYFKPIVQYLGFHNAEYFRKVFLEWNIDFESHQM